ncbi:MAG: rod shape-determining protein RodA [Rhodobacterales bacterium]|nr:MAG: rod shape-determining protein RodA [Rhodobacterales bacterium]
MSYLEYHQKWTPSGPTKILYFNWVLVALITAVACAGFLMLYSVAGGDFSRWSQPMVERFGMGLGLMFFIGLVPIWFWRNMAALLFALSLALLVAVPFIGETNMGAQRWINLGFIRLQPSELVKLTLVMVLAAYYDWLDVKKVSHPLWVLVPVVLILLPAFLVLRQPDLGTALLLALGGGAVMFLAGVSLWYFAAVLSAGVGAVVAVFLTRGTPYQLLKDYQYRRIDTFLDPSLDPLGSAYHITQSKIALGSGGWTGRGFMQGTQSRLNFLPEKQTDFIFTALAEEFGFVGATSLLIAYFLIMATCVISALRNTDRFGSLVTLGVVVVFFLLFAVNMSMVMGMAPVVGVPLPLVSFGGSAMLVLMIGFGLVQSAHVHRARSR